MDEVLPAVVENEVAPSFDDEEAVEKAEVEAVAAPQEPVFKRCRLSLHHKNEAK